MSGPKSAADASVARRTDGAIVLTTYSSDGEPSTSLVMNDSGARWLIEQLQSALITNYQKIATVSPTAETEPPGKETSK